ncbi:MAG: protein kinase domain-containing protein [Archangium sp.]
MPPFMPGEVICPTCGTASPTQSRTCPKCGTSLAAGGDATSRSKTLQPGTRKPAIVVRKPAAAAAADAPVNTLPDDEPAPAKPRVRPAGGPVPQTAAGAPRRSAPQRVPANALESTSGASRDGLIGKAIQDYVIEKKLGVGGMGVVFKATHKLIGKSVAIKVLRPDIVQDPRDMDRLLDEARIISSIKNRGIINIFGAGTLDDGRHYLIMELLEGEGLEQLMQREGKVPAGDAVVILEQVLSALTAAHEAGVVHRDLKPANVFLVKEGNLMYVKLLDFGLARRNQQNVTRIAGTPDYISPEHARGRPAGPPADLYAFGILCFHMLTGRLPFIGTTPMEVMEKHVHEPPPVPHEINKEIPKALSELILKLLAKEPGERPDSAHVKADLRAATKQLRNAATMMSLMQIEAVAEDAAPKGAAEKKRARELAVEAQVADIKRKVTRRWPWVLAGVVGVWLVAVGIYVMWPTKPPEPPTIGKRPRTPDVPRDPTPVPTVKDPVVDVRQPDRPTKVDPAPTVNDPQPTGTDQQVAEAPDAATDEPPQLIEENPNTPIDDVRLGELKRGKRIDERLDEIVASMKNNEELRQMLGELVKRTRDRCDAARTLGDFYDCDDEVTKQYNRYLKNI